MTIRYCGPGGNNANDGLTWATRKLTLNGVEDTPVVAGDTVYVGPGVYRETLTCDVSGTSGSPITYIGDVTGEHTDGVGGIVRITGSNNDTTATRGSCISATSKNYRTFRGFSFDTVSGTYTINVTDGSNWIISDCTFYGRKDNVVVYFVGANQLNNTVERCCFYFGGYNSIGIQFTNAAPVDNTGHIVANCIMINFALGVASNNGGMTVKNNLFAGSGMRVYTLSDGQTVTANNNIFVGCTTAAQSTVLGDFVENYNSFYSNNTDRTNVEVGANSNTYPPLFNPPLLQDGFRFPWYFGELSKWSQLDRITGTGEATDDLFGLTRPATASKKSWGAIQATEAARETTTIDGVSGASIKLPDAGEQFLMRVPVSAVSTVFSLKCYREADYAGTNPQMIIRQAGQADNVTTDVGAASAWNTLSATLTPAASPGWVDIFIRSSNTAVAGNYDVFFDSVTVT